MFSRLQQKWNVTGPQLFLVLCTFALGGSLCGYLTRLIIQPLEIENAFGYGTLYFVCLTVLWPFTVIAVSIPLGQFSFFRNYLRKMGSRMGLGVNAPEGSAASMDEEAVNPVYTHKWRLAVFASGSGSNALKIMEYFKGHPQIEVALLVSNKPGAGALHHAANHGVSTLIIEKEHFFRGNAYIPDLHAAGINFIVLAGFLWKIPAALIAAYPNRIINIHPALLPKYGGKGMYGKHVHEAVIAQGDEESGITIHYVDEHYDHGATIFQAICPVHPHDTPDTLADRIHQLEHLHFARVIEGVLMERG